MMGAQEAIDLWEDLWFPIVIGLVLLGKSENRKPMGFYHQICWALRLKFSHHPIL